MFQYLILQDPGHNRVYYAQSKKLCLAELNIAVKRLSNECIQTEEITIAGISYFSFSLNQEISEDDLGIISRLSFAFALFQNDEKEGIIRLSPIHKFDYANVDPKISSLLKYPGKTNELFTKMMVNIALLSSKFSYDDNIQLLDPVAGRGTTLFEGSIYGFDCFGIELESKSTNEANLFFKKFLERERYKHRSAKRDLNAHDKSNQSYIYEFEFAKNKDLYNQEETRKNMSFITGNSGEVGRFFRNNSLHLIVGDLPYGVAHGNTAQKKQGGITRSPKALLELCLPEWKKVLMPGGTIVLAWNTFVMPKEDLTELINYHGFEVLLDEDYNNFEHRVDNAIKRDIVVARKL